MRTDCRSGEPHAFDGEFSGCLLFVGVVVAGWRRVLRMPITSRYFQIIERLDTSTPAHSRLKTHAPPCPIRSKAGNSHPLLLSVAKAASRIKQDIAAKARFMLFMVALEAFYP
jgi:hypothetical protein